MRYLKLTTYYLLLIVLAVILTGCVIPDVPDVTPEPECLIIQEGGHYIAYFSDWQKCTCPSCSIFPKGTYWVNADGTMFLIGEPVINAPAVYGIVPSDCLMIIDIDET